MTRSQRWLVLGLLASLALPGSFAIAQPGGPPGPPGPPPFGDVLERHADELGLDANTRAAIRDLAARAREEEQPLAEQLRSLHDQMHTLLDTESPKLEDVLAQADRIGAAETALKKQRLRTMLEIRALLTPDQRHQLVQIFEERRGHRRGFDGEPPGPPPPD